MTGVVVEMEVPVMEVTEPLEGGRMGLAVVVAEVAEGLAAGMWASPKLWLGALPPLPEL